MLVSRRSVLLSFSILLSLITRIQNQQYDADYRVTDNEEDEDHDSYSDEPKRTDYSKYYASDRSTPVIGGTVSSAQDEGAGFVTPLDFTGLFTDGHFGFDTAAGATNVGNIFNSPVHQPFGTLQESASTNNHSGFVSPHDFRPFFDIGASATAAGFGAKDFLGTPASHDQSGNFFATFGSVENAPGPNYVAHTAVAPTERYKLASTKPHYRKTKPNSKTDNYDPEHYKSDEEYSTTYIPPTLQSFESKSEYQTPDYSEYDGNYGPSSAPYSTTSFSTDFTPTELISTVEPHNGKSSYNVKPTLNTLSAKTQYYPVQTLNEDQKYNTYSTLTPYQKYSFQPSNYFDTIASTALPSIGRPFTKLPPTTAPSTLASPNRDETELVTRKKCRKVEKHLPQDGRFRRQAMTCFICKDAKSGGTYEQCSYTSEPNEKAYFVGKKYTSSTTDPTTGYRYKRYAERTIKRRRSDADDPTDYDFSSHKATKYKSRPDAFVSSSYNAPDFKEFHYQTHDDVYDDPNYYSFDPIIESHSAQQSEQINQGKCKKIEKETMTCMVCENPKTGGSFEQCSYTSQPKEKKYAYSNERNFDSNDDDSDEGEGSEQKPAVTKNERTAPRQRNYQDPEKDEEPSSEICEEVKKGAMICEVCKNTKTGGKSQKCSYRSEPNPKKYAYRNERQFQKGRPHDRNVEETETKPVVRGRDHARRYERQTTTPQPIEDQEAPRQKYDRHHTVYHDEAYEVPKHFERAAKNREKNGVKPGGVGLDPELYGRPVTFDVKKEETEEKEKQMDDHTYEEYFSKLFPEYTGIKEEEVGNRGAASEHTEDSHGFENPEEFFADSSRKDVEEVLAEFAKKDRSKCKKITKDKLTCYMCTDEKGRKNEECMYVTESEPKNSHMAYHHVQKFRSVPETPSTPKTALPIAPAESKLAVNLTAVPSSETPLIIVTTTPTQTIPIGRKRKYKKSTTQIPNIPSANIESARPDETSHYHRRSNAYPTVPVVQVKITKTSRLPRRTTNLRLVPYSDSLNSGSGTHYVYQRPPKEQTVQSESNRQERTTAIPEEPELPKPIEFEVEGSDGAFASELKPIYSKRFGVTLPAFMLTKSEHEAAFDEAVASSK